VVTILAPKEEVIEEEQKEEEISEEAKVIQEAENKAEGEGITKENENN